jgi:kynurenine formamidase
VPPIVLLDAKKHIGRGQPMKAGELVTAKHIMEMLKAQGLAKRGIQPGDVVYVRTGWGDHLKDLQRLAMKTPRPYGDEIKKTFDELNM